MLDFVKTERRDYQPVFDVTVKGLPTESFYLTCHLTMSADFPDQEKMVLTADVKFKGTGQHNALKGMVRHVLTCGTDLCLSWLSARRRNRWICALKTTLAEVKIYGPKGNPDETSTLRYTRVPWELIENEDRKAAQTHASPPDYPAPNREWRLSDSQAVMREFISSLSWNYH
jgi:hypothetical protein